MPDMGIWVAIAAAALRLMCVAWAACADSPMVKPMESAKINRRCVIPDHMRLSYQFAVLPARGRSPHNRVTGVAKWPFCGKGPVRHVINLLQMRRSQSIVTFVHLGHLLKNRY